MDDDIELHFYHIVTQWRILRLWMRGFQVGSELWWHPQSDHQHIHGKASAIRGWVGETTCKQSFSSWCNGAEALLWLQLKKGEI